MANCRQRETSAATGAPQECIGYLDQDPGAVALQRVSAGSAAMREILQNLQRLRHDRVTLLSLDVGDEAQTARVVLVGRIVQALLRRHPFVTTRRRAADYRSARVAFGRPCGDAR